jgi:hypothetical protein
MLLVRTASGVLVLETVLVIAWFVVFVPLGVLVACNAWALADRIFALIARYAITGVYEATPRTVRLIASAMVVIVTCGLPVILLQRSQTR